MPFLEYQVHFYLSLIFRTKERSSCVLQFHRKLFIYRVVFDHLIDVCLSHRLYTPRGLTTVSPVYIVELSHDR